MKTLHLNLKKKWFDMILSGEKKEEYREIKQYWVNRFLWHEFHKEVSCENSLIDAIYENSESDSPLKMPSVFNTLYHTITFKNGYQKNAPTFTIEFLGIEIGEPKSKWSDNWKGNVFIIKLGKIIKP